MTEADPFLNSTTDHDIEMTVIRKFYAAKLGEQDLALPLVDFHNIAAVNLGFS